MITPEQIRKQKSEYEIFTFYLSPYTKGRVLKNGEKFLSPLRVEKNPSFNIYEYNGRWYFKDYGGEQGDVIKLVMILFNLNFPQALLKIYHDLNLIDSKNAPK